MEDSSRIYQRLSRKTRYTVLRCLQPLSLHLRLVSRRKAAVGCLDKLKPLWFHVWRVLPVTGVIPLLPTGGFPSPAFPPPFSVIRARGREKHNYRTEESITQRLRRLHVTDHWRKHITGKWLLHHLIILMPAISYTGELLTTPGPIGHSSCVSALLLSREAQK